jgi:hypothetical protein
MYDAHQFKKKVKNHCTHMDVDIGMDMSMSIGMDLNMDLGIGMDPGVPRPCPVQEKGTNCNSNLPYGFFNLQRKKTIRDCSKNIYIYTYIKSICK